LSWQGWIACGWSSDCFLRCCRIGRAQAFKIAAIADGRTTEEKEREKQRAADQRYNGASTDAVGSTENTGENGDDGTRAADEAAMGIKPLPRGMPWAF